MIYSMVPFQGHGVITDALDILCVQLTRDLFAIAKFLYFGLMKFYKIWWTYS